MTPIHAQAPDVDAAVRLLEATQRVYDLELDTGPLEEFAAEVQSYYEELGDQLASQTEVELPDDRMYT